MNATRKADDRGLTDIGWLHSRHSFSFGEYRDPERDGFGPLRVINDDRIGAGMGFGMHPHRDMEILTWVVAGKLEHRDSLGTGSTIGPGEIQRMTAGTGIRHSEFNPSPSEPLRLLQIWIVPEARGLTPEYEQLAYADADLRNRLAVLASHGGRAGGSAIHRDLTLFASRLDAGAEVSHVLAPGRRVWVQVVAGTVEIGGNGLVEGDAWICDETSTFAILAGSSAEVLVFDIAGV